ncbi:lysine-N-methylase [Tindallia magadiensis]|uniref:Lysine-N-methylase n=1 Tax=Tindallia magadiensis TaxID=69895 RepID=A0A1I3C7M8_9FIRM|nr:flagellin lysine-N-methylase [Tindallia magadiensis]SFH70326.1 lysine-N-methylase [Tindallia magadiensis]
MTEKKRVVLEPTYMKQFHCIGSACEDSCCIGWRVDLDKKTYLAYKNIQNQTLKPLMEKQVSRKHNQKSDKSYGKIKMEKNGRCPFLDEKNLCKVYIHAGESYLSDTCRFYPRMVKKVDGKFERAATPSCPEIVRVGLLNPDGIAFQQVEESRNLPIVVKKQFDTEGHTYLNKAQRYFWEIRMFSLNLLQNRNYSLSDRLVLLGITYQKMEALQKEKRVKEIPGMIISMKEKIGDGSFREELEKIPANTKLQMRLVKAMTDKRVLEGVRNKRYIECLKETLLGIGYEKGWNIEGVNKKYDDHYREYVVPYLEEKEYILENFLVNEYFKELMPFGSFESIWDSYLYLCMLYSMVKLHMIGMAGYHQGLTDELMIKLIQSLSKIVLHNNRYIQRMITQLRDNNQDSLAFMAILVKN